MFANESNHYEWSIMLEASPSLSIVVIMALIVILSPFLNLFLLYFLQDLPINKQCIMNTLYQDTIKVNLLLVCFWTLSGMIYKCVTETRNVSLISTFNDSILALNEGLYSVTMIYLSLIGGLRLYTTRYNVLDPLTKFFGSNEDKILRSIRLILLAIFLCITSGILISSTKPMPYFYIRRECSTPSSLPLSTLQITVYDAVLFVVSAMLHISAKVYQNWQDSKIRKDLLELEFQLNRSRRNMIELEIQWNKSLGIDTNNADDALKNSIESELDGGYFRSMPYLENLPVIVYMMNCFLIMIILFLNCTIVEDVITINFWWSITIFVGNQGLLIPLAIVFWYPDIRSYYYRKFCEYYDFLVSCYESIEKRCRKRTMRRVIPIGEVEIEMA